MKILQSIKRSLPAKLACVYLFSMTVFCLAMALIWHYEHHNFNQHIWTGISHSIAQHAPENGGESLAGKWPAWIIISPYARLPESRTQACPEEDGMLYLYNSSEHRLVGHSIGNSEQFVIIDINKANGDFSQYSTPVTVLLLLMISIIFIMFSVMYLIYKFLYPARNLLQTLSGFNVHSLPKAFSEQYNHDEIGQLARVFEAKALRIEAFIQREHEFTRDVSHELRTSNAIIKNIVSELLQNPQFNDSIKEKLASIQNANFESENTIATLLHLARENHIPQDISAINVLAVVETQVIQHCYLLEGKDVQVNVDVDPSERVLMQSGAFKILLSNLISNAFQYTQTGSVSIDFHNSVLSVTDTGIGIPEEIRLNVNQPFVKGGLSRGYGVGMAIVQRLCDTYKLRIRISSTEPQHGTKVAVYFD
ncbi:sensor histidine kinase [Alteromonas sp. CYL-A6]|uniref:sensor histidine kinase n=1 Tax=Alteromonas nitratireducens TaxID=3390813 RepID=UPI0034B25C03